MLSAIVNFVMGNLGLIVLNLGLFGAGIAAAVVLDVKAPGVYDFLTRKFARFLLRF